MGLQGRHGISWTDYTFNPWEGCEKVSPGCKNCYAAARDRRMHGGRHWGPGSNRLPHSEAYWDQPLRWNREAAKVGRIARVFCGSLCDILEQDYRSCNECGTNTRLPQAECAGCFNDLRATTPARGLDALRERYFKLVPQTPNLMHLFLTKRPDNWRLFPESWLKQWPSNAMFGFTGENDEWFHRRARPIAAELPSNIPLFLSAEPLLGPLNAERLLPMFSWVICGGESDHGARPMHPDWARSLRDQCAAAGVPFFFKQWGEWREPLEREEYDTRWGRMKQRGKMPVAFLVSEENGTVACFHDGTPRKVMLEVGKKTAGRLLDGREWNELPKRWPSNVGLLQSDSLVVLGGAA